MPEGKKTSQTKAIVALVILGGIIVGCVAWLGQIFAER